MFELKKSFTFEASHRLAHHNGKCAQLHGHSYTLKIRVRKDSLISEGSSKNMVVDFGDISVLVKPLIEKFLDHHDLNETLGTDSPSAEFIARWVYQRLKPCIPGVYSVTIQETASASATYWEQ